MKSVNCTNGRANDFLGCLGQKSVSEDASTRARSQNEKIFFPQTKKLIDREQCLALKLKNLENGKSD